MAIQQYSGGREYGNIAGVKYINNLDSYLTIKNKIYVLLLNFYAISWLNYSATNNILEYKHRSNNNQIKKLKKIKIITAAKYLHTKHKITET